MLAFLNNYFFFLFLTTLAVSNNLVFFFISWVGLNISLYGILLKSFNSYSKEITLKYFISGSVITMFLLFSVLIYFINYFTFDIGSASYLFFLNNNTPVLFDTFSAGLLNRVFYSILVSSLLFKLGAFPFHFYLPDMYQALNERETMFLYTVSLKISIFFTLLKFLSSFWYINNNVLSILIVSGFGSIFVSSFSIIKQYKLAKFWAYSYLNSIGFVILALASGISTNVGEISFYSAKVYFFTYIFVWFGILDFISRYSFSFATSKQGQFVKKKFMLISDLMFLNSNESTYVSKYRFSDFGRSSLAFSPRYSFVAMLSSLLGLPPAIGFFSKALVYFELSSNVNTVLVFWLVLLISPLAAIGYLKLIIYSVVILPNKNTLFEVSGKDVVLLEEPNDYFFSYRFVSLVTVFLPFFYYSYLFYFEYISHLVAIC